MSEPVDSAGRAPRSCRASARPSRQSDGHRLAYLDGLRGVAILLVLVFHAYVRWRDRLPFGDTFAVPPLAQGWVGVQLFFIISGFVIFMTLERSRSLVDFAWRRWLRLFPAMLIATVVIVATAPLLPERPHGAVRMADILPGLLFVDPKWWALFRIDVAPLEGVFWSLFVEVQFYAIAGCAFFAAGRRGAILALAGLYVAAEVAASDLVPAGTFIHRVAFAITDRLGAVHYAWFIGGALIYVFTQTRGWTVLGLGIATLVVAVVMHRPPAPWLEGKLALASVAALFVAALLSGPLQRFLARPGFLFLGFVSYPLYLVHENMMIAATIALAAAVPELPGWAMPVLPMGFVIAIAWAIARYAEPALRALFPSPRTTAERGDARLEARPAAG